MAPKRKRKEDPDVIKTERDHRRATGRDDDDDFEAAEELNLHLEESFTSVGYAIYKRSKLRKSLVGGGEPFPFMKLPPEIRNMIYRYLVVSKATGKISLDHEHYHNTGGIETAIMSTSRQVYNEAAKIMYDENKCVSNYRTWCPGVSLRVDDPKTKATTFRSLRSGRAVCMVKHKGLIYEHVLKRLRHVEFNVALIDRTNMCDHVTIAYANQIRGHLVALGDFIFSLHLAEKNISTHGKDWKIVLCSPGLLGHLIMKKLLEPLLQYHVYTCVGRNKLKLVLEGKFPLSWEKIFHRFKGKGFVTDKLEAVDASGADISLFDSDELDEYFDVFHF